MTPFAATDPSVIARVPDLAPFRRGDRWLVLSPQTGFSILLEGPRLKLFGALARPVAVSRLHQLHPELPEAEIQGLLRELSQSGMLQVAGRPAPAPVEPPPAPGARPWLTLRLTEGCSPSCPSCAQGLGEKAAVLSPGQAREAVQQGLEGLPEGPVRLDLSGAEPLLAPEALEASIGRARELRPDLEVAVRTGGHLLDPERAAALAALGACAVVCLHEAPGQPGAEPGLLHDRARGALDGLPGALATGLSWAPLGVARRPGQALAFFRLFMGLGFRTMRLEQVPPEASREDRDQVLEAQADDLLAVADAAIAHESRVPLRLRVHPLEGMLGHLASGTGGAGCGHPECDSGFRRAEAGFEPPPSCARAFPAASQLHPRCPRCPFFRQCRGGCRRARGERQLDSRCRYWLRAYEGLLWRLHEEPQWIGCHR